MPPSTDLSPINLSISELEKKTTVLETRFEYIEDAIDQNKQKLTSIGTKVDEIGHHIAKQNGAIPY